MVHGTKPGVLSEVGAAPWHVPANEVAFSLAGILIVNSVCPARPLLHLETLE